MMIPAAEFENPLLGSLEDVIQQYRYLIRYAARRFKWAIGRQGINRDDLESEATIGLIKAYRRFDGRQGRNGKPVRFASYAVPFMLGEISRFLQRCGQPVKVTKHLYELAGKIIKRGLTECSTAEIIDQVACTEADAQRSLKYLREVRGVSLEEPIGEDAGTIADIIADHADETAADVAIFISQLTARQRSYLQLIMRGECPPDPSGNTLQLLQQKARHYFEYTEGESVKELTKTAYNVAKGRGMSDNKIAEQYGFSVSHIYRLKKKWGLVGPNVKAQEEQACDSEPAFSEPAEPEKPTQLGVDWQERYEGLSAEYDAVLEQRAALQHENDLLKALLKKYL